MADNIVLNAGSGGSTVRTISDASAIEWPAAVVCYATSTTPGSATFQFISTTAGMPVVSQTGATWAVTQSGSWTVAATQSGSWTVTTGDTVAQGSTTSGQSGPLIQGAVTTGAPSYTTAKTEPLSLDTSGNLRVLAAPSGTFTVSGTVAATQSGTWNIGTVTTVTTCSTVTAVTTITNPVTVQQSTASSLNATVVGTGTFAVQAAQSGTWNVGTVTTVSTVSAVTAISNALPAGTNLLGSMSVADQVANLYNGTTAVTPAYAVISTSSSGATSVVSGSAGKKIYVLRWSISANGNTNVNLQSHTTTSLATGLRYLTQYATAGGAYCPAGIMATASGEGLDVNNSAAVAIAGEVTYVQF